MMGSRILSPVTKRFPNSVYWSRPTARTTADRRAVQDLFFLHRVKTILSIPHLPPSWGSRLSAAQEPSAMWPWRSFEGLCPGFFQGPLSQAQFRSTPMSLLDPHLLCECTHAAKKESALAKPIVRSQLSLDPRLLISPNQAIEKTVQLRLQIIFCSAPFKAPVVTHLLCRSAPRADWYKGRAGHRRVEAGTM